MVTVDIMAECLYRRLNSKHGSAAIDTIQNISDITLLMTYVKQKIHTNIFLNYVKHLLAYFALEL